MRMNAAVAHGCLALLLVCCCAFDFAADAPLTEGQKLEKDVKQLIAESDKLLMTEKGYTRDQKAVEEGIKKLERAEELAGKASELDPDKYDKLAQTVAMKLYGARKNTTLHLADTPRKTVATAPQPPKQAPPVAPATTTPPPAVTPPATTPPAPPPAATTPPANTPPWPPEAPAVGTVKAVADATKPTTPAPAATTPAPETPTRRNAAPEPETPTRRNAAPEPETTTRKPAEAAPETTRRVADANVSEGAARRAREAAAAAEAPAAPANAAPPVAAPPVIRRDKVFVLKDGRKIVAQRVIDTETEHVIKDMAGKTHAVSKEDVAQVIEQDTVIGGAPGEAAAPSKKFTVYTLKDGRKINAVKVLDVGEQLSIKDDRNKFIVIEKADVVDPKL